MKKVCMNLIFGVFVMVVSLALVSNNGWAGGSGVYPNGVESFLIGAAPPPGFYFKNYLGFITADEMTNDDGDDTHLLNRMTTVADVARFIWVSKKKILGAQYISHLFVPFLNVNLKFNQPLGPKMKNEYSDAGVPYLIYAPLALGYHLADGKLHFILNPSDIYIPMGNTQEENMASVGRNSWTFEPVFAVTLMPTPELDISFKFMYDFTTHQTGYASAFGTCDRHVGQEFHFDYGISYAINKALKIGACGYYYKQTTEDNYTNIEEAFPGAANLLEATEDEKSEVWAIGPGVWYNYHNWFFTLRAQFDVDSENATEGQRYWFTFIRAF